MKNVRLKEIELHNFKGTRERVVAFSGNETIISGDNGVGKTTIYDAYLWCLFGKTSGINQTVQPLDANNDIIHHVDTSVSVTLLVDGVRVLLTRTITEKWRGLGTPEEKFIGTEIQRFYNDVPLSMREFNAKLNAIMPTEQWQLFSDNAAFMGLKTEERRKMLIEAAGEVDEEALLRPFPQLDAVLSEGKTIEEAVKQANATKKKSQAELNAIPNMITAQDALRVVADFETLRNDKAAVEEQLAEVDSLLQGDAAELESIRQYNEAKKALEDQLYKEREKSRMEYLKKKEDVQAEKGWVKSQLINAKHNEEEINAAISSNTKAKLALSEEIEKLKDQWREINKEVFVFTETSVCPVCGRPFTDEMKRDEKENAVKEFNARKVARLEKVLGAVREKQRELAIRNDTLRALTIEYTKIEAEVVSYSAALEKVEKEEVALVFVEPQIIGEIERKIASLQQPIANTSSDKEALKSQKNALAQRKDELIRLLAGQETNRVIDKKKVELQERATTLAQIVADCDSILYQASAYKKAKIDAIEDKVNALFSLVSWKFFEQNRTNPDLCEVCTCVIDGVDYTNLNLSAKINANIDIINGLAASAGVSLPVFIDGRESATEIIKSNNQLISLKVESTEGESKINVINF